MNDLDLLKKYEPVLAFTNGELFFPSAIEGYLKRSSLWQKNDQDELTELIPVGQLTPDKLGEYQEIPSGYTLSLRFVNKTLDPLAYNRWLNRADKPEFHAGGRLSRVGLFSRILDGIFDLSLLIRGTIPGQNTAVAEQQFRQMRKEDPRDVYYARVIREGGWIILHYLFFYPANDWRNTYSGVNDHEADWEQIFVYLSDNESQPIPAWVAYAAHDLYGDDLRRRWDDPELQKHEGTHPIVFAGAGSHASYFTPGEYLMRSQPNFLNPISTAIYYARKFWAETLGQGITEHIEHNPAFLSVPFVDYARGDGVWIGPGHAREWTPVMLTQDMRWAEHYRGLWGLDTNDPLGGERAPAGPKYQRDGSVRKSWYDPLGWAGLDKLTPPDQMIDELHQNLQVLNERLAEVASEIEDKRTDLRLRELQVEALNATEYLEALYEERKENLDVNQHEFQELHTKQVQIKETIFASEHYLARIENGEWGNPRSHIQHSHDPEPPAPVQSKLVELWAAVSSGLLLLMFTILMIINLSNWLIWVVAVAMIFVTIEAVLRGRLAQLLTTIVIVLAIIASLVLFVEYARFLIPIGMFLLIGFLIFTNVREVMRN